MTTYKVTNRAEDGTYTHKYKRLSNALAYIKDQTGFTISSYMSYLDIPMHGMTDEEYIAKKGGIRITDDWGRSFTLTTLEA